MDLPSQITGMIMVELDEKAVKPLQKSMKEVISRLDDIIDSREQLLLQVEAIKEELHEFDQKQIEINTALQNQSSKQQELINQLVIQREYRASHDQLPLPKEEAVEKMMPSPLANEVDQSAFRFNIDIYPRPDHTYAGRIQHPFSKDKTSLKGLDGAEIQSFIQKHLPAAPPSPKSIKVISEPTAKQLQQQHHALTAAPPPAAKSSTPAVIKFKLIQDKQALEKAPFRLQANKTFAVAMELSLPLSSEDSVKGNYMLAYQSNMAVLVLPQRKQIYNAKVNGGMNSKQPRDVKLVNFNQLARGRYLVEITLLVPQKQIAKKEQLEISVD
jgi:hypothetical protein